MSSNKPFAQPADYPIAFHAAIANGAGLLYNRDLPWSTLVAAKRFRQLLALIRAAGPAHPLHRNASHRWTVKPEGLALTVSINLPKAPRSLAVSALLIGRVTDGGQ
jgi:hypothetical protein